MGASPRRYPEAFRTEAVDVVCAGERSLPQIAHDLGINEQTLRNWVKRAEIDAGRGASGDLTSDERAELARPRGENRVLQQEKEILKKGRSLVREGDAVSRYRFIVAHQASYPIALMCCVLNVARSGYDAWLRRGVSCRRQTWPTRRAVRQAIFDWIEGFCNRQWLHSALGYQSPVAFEEGLTTVRLVA